MATVKLLPAMLIIAFLLRRVGAIHVEFNRAGVFEANLEERLSFNCTAPPYHMSELLEIGQTETIEELLLRSPQPGDPASYYDPEHCQFTDEGSHCSKIIDMTVTEAMVGKAFQCRSFKRGEDHTYYYSQGGYIQVRNIIPSPTTSEATTVVDPVWSTSVVTCATPPVPQHELGNPNIASSVSQCECSGGTTLSPHLSLLIPLLALPLLFTFYTNNP